MQRVEVTARRSDSNVLDVIVSERIVAVMFGILTAEGVPCELPKPFKRDKSIFEIRRDPAGPLAKHPDPLRWLEASVDKGLDTLGVQIEKTRAGESGSPKEIRWTFDMRAAVLGTAAKNNRLTKPLSHDQRRPDVLHQLSDTQIDAIKRRQEKKS